MTAARRIDIAFASVLIACLIILFARGLFLSEVPAFRDAFLFYYPQAVWLDQCAAKGILFPQWNPNEGLGVSVTGQATSALYYPLRVLWLVPGFSVAQRFALFITIHLLLAAIGFRYATSKLRLSPSAGWLAGFSFCLSCPVFFQHSNLIYLVSASWIGFALGALIELFRGHRFFRSCLAFGVATSFMLLGGDPQTAVNAFIVAFVSVTYSVTRNIYDSCIRIGAVRLYRESLQQSLRKAAWLVLALAVLMVTTSLQWVPMLNWAQHSHRNSDLAFNIETVSLGIENLDPGLGREIERVSIRQHRIYDFSLSPWHIATLVWPTLGGKFVPSNSRWFAAIGAEGRMWIPSLYAGLIPVLFFVHGYRSRKKSGFAWINWLAVLALLFSFGNYSIVWMAGELFSFMGAQDLSKALPKDHIGSFYWLLAEFVPGYGAFRYPAKWTVWFAAAIALGAAVSVEHHFQSKSRMTYLKIPRILLLASMILACAAGAVLVSASTESDLLSTNKLDAWFDSQATDIWLGTPSAYDAAWQILVAAIVPVTLAVVLSRIGHITSEKLAALTLLEAALISTFWLSFAPVPDLGVPKAQSDKKLPRLWVDNSEANILRDKWLDSKAAINPQVHYQEAFLIGKLASTANVANLASQQTIEPTILKQLRIALARMDNLTSEQPKLDYALRSLGVTHRLTRSYPSDGEKAVFHWRPIGQTRKLCELKSLGAGPLVGKLQWHWESPSQLFVHANLAAPSVLVIGQFNDGGWKAESVGDDSESLHIAPTPSVFVEVSLPKGPTHFSLSRKWWR